MARHEDSEEDRQAQDAIRSRANRSVSIVEKTMFTRFGRWPNLHPDWPRGFREVEQA